MANEKCIVCGKENKPGESAEYEFSYGTISVCYKCRPAFIFKLNGENVPIGWISKEDLYCPDVSQGKFITEEEANNLTMDDIYMFARHIEEWLNEETAFNTYEILINKALPGWRQEKEEELVRNTPPKELPTLIGSLKYKDNIQFLEQRLKGENK